jgi:hypothetical protein
MQNLTRQPGWDQATAQPVLRDHAMPRQEDHELWIVIAYLNELPQDWGESSIALGTTT